MSSRDLLPEQAAAGEAQVVARLEALASVLARENEALKAQDTTRMRRLLEEKQAALLACERWLGSDEGTGGGVLADDAFAALKSRLDGLAEENQRRLRVAIAANQRLVESIAVAVQSQAAGSDTYASNGRTEAPHPRRAGPPPALSVNRAL